MSARSVFRHDAWASRVQDAAVAARMSAFSANRYYQKWRRIDEIAPLAWVIEGGALADSMADIFMGGYQIAMRLCFGFDGRDWTAFCVSEGADGYAPVTVNDDGTLSGYKTWVAAASVMDQFLLKVGRGSEAQYFVLPRNADGLSIEIKPKSGFLPELDVGRLRLEQVVMGETLDIDRPQLKRFSKIEAGCILLAFLGRLQAGGQPVAADLIESFGAGVLKDPEGAALSELARGIRDRLLPDPDLVVPIAFWERDRGLVDQYLKLLA